MSTSNATPLVPENFKSKRQAASKVNLDLWDAAHKGDLERLKIAIENGGNPDYINITQEGAPSSLHAAARLENGGDGVDCVEKLLENGAEINAKLISNFNTPLYEASSNGALEVCKVLIGAGAAVNYGSNNSFGNTPLHAATRTGAVEVVQLLTKNGSEINAVNNRGSTALHFCSFLSLNDKENQKEEDIKKILSSNNYLKIAVLLIINGIDVDRPDLNGYTALHVAAQRGCMEIVKLLVDSGASLDKKTLVDHKGRGGRTPAEMARFGGQTEVMDFLIKAANNSENNSSRSKGSMAKNLLENLSQLDKDPELQPVGSGANFAKHQNLKS